MNLTFYYVRHGQTLFNVQGKMQGWCDSPLTEKGIEDAKKARVALQKVIFARAFTSTSERCIDTAHIILDGRNVPLFPVKELKEINFGTLEGEKISEILPEMQKRWETEDYSDLGGENSIQVQHRLYTLFERITSGSHENDHILIVSHGACFLQLLESLNIMKVDEFMQKYRQNTNDSGPVRNGLVAVITYHNGVYSLSKVY